MNYTLAMQIDLSEDLPQSVQSSCFSLVKNESPFPWDELYKGLRIYKGHF